MNLYNMIACNNDWRNMTDTEKEAFLRKSKGFLTRCAESCGVSVGQVSRTFWGRSQGRQQIIDAINAGLAIAAQSQPESTGRRTGDS